MSPSNGPSMQLRIDKERFPYYVAHQRIFFTGENFCEEIPFWMEVDPEKGEPSEGPYETGFDIRPDSNYGIWKELEEGLVEVTLEGTGRPEESFDGLYAGSCHRPSPSSEKLSGRLCDGQQRCYVPRCEDLSLCRYGRDCPVYGKHHAGAGGSHRKAGQAATGSPWLRTPRISFTAGDLFISRTASLNASWMTR